MPSLVSELYPRTSVPVSLYLNGSWETYVLVSGTPLFASL